MKLVNRSALIVRPREPHIQWAASLDQPGHDDGEAMRSNVSVYLVPQDLEGVREAAPLEGLYTRIFAEELLGWYRDTSRWPKKRTLAMFLDWFEVTEQSIVFDMGEGPLRADEE